LPHLRWARRAAAATSGMAGRLRQTTQWACADCIPILIHPPQGFIMNKFEITAIAAAITFAFSTGALAAMSKADYQSAKTNIATEYKSAKAGCDSFAANAKDICMAEAKGGENVALAELEAGYKPTKKTRFNVSIAKAEAAFAVAREKCDDKAGNDKDVCVKEAQAAQIAAKADAKAAMKTADANAVASDKTAAARATANEKNAAARGDAASDKRNADYAVAKEKCDTFAADAKAACLRDAKARFGQS
jgi:hypothetical protein